MLAGGGGMLAQAASWVLHPLAANDVTFLRAVCGAARGCIDGAVAVKVQYPGLQAQIASDLNMIQMALMMFKDRVPFDLTRIRLDVTGVRITRLPWNPCK